MSQAHVTAMNELRNATGTFLCPSCRFSRALVPGTTPCPDCGTDLIWSEDTYKAHAKWQHRLKAKR